MKAKFLAILCVLCIVLSACTPVVNQVTTEPDVTPAPPEPKPTPGLTLIAPDDIPENSAVDHEPVDFPNSPSQGNTQQGGSGQGGNSQGGSTSGEDTESTPSFGSDELDSEFEVPILPE